MLTDLYTEPDDAQERASDVRTLAERDAKSTQQETMSRATGIGLPVQYEPAWLAAREAARHARAWAKDRAGEAKEAQEREQQAGLVEFLLVRRPALFAHAIHEGD